jgi:hypothetical protein
MRDIEIEIVYPAELNVRFSRDCSAEINYHVILEEIFAEWNRGSGQESRLFLNNKCRSLSVGDFVRIHDKWFQCENIGWNEVQKDFVTNFQKEVEKYLQHHANHIPFSATQMVLRGII